MSQTFAIFVNVMRQLKSFFDADKSKKTEKSKNMLYGIVFNLASLKKGSIFATLS